MKEIKVLHISETFAAGVYTYIKDICEFFDQTAEFKNYVIYSGKRIDTDKEKFKNDFSEKIKLIEVGMEREVSPLRDIISTINIANKIREIKPDIIHLHSSKASILGRIASKAYPRAKVYYTPNGYSFLRQDVSKRKRKLYFFLEKNITRFFGGITIACGDTEYVHAKKIGTACLVRNGLEISSVEKYNRDNKSKEFTIGTIGRLSPQKNPNLFNQIALKFPDTKFIWVGDGELKHLLTAPNIQITGWMPRAKVLEHINNFNIYIQTSLWEGLPFTIIEAMILEKPIIATNVVGNKDAVKNEYNGYLCNNLSDFESSILKVKKSKDTEHELGTASNLRAKELFNRNSNFKQLKEIYRHFQK